MLRHAPHFLATEVNYLAFVLFWLLVTLVAGQTFLVIGFVRALRRKPPERLPDGQLPRAIVLLCLRGNDPYLADCLDALLRQDYPDYDVRVVVDHADDPAGPIVAAAIDASGASNVVVELLEQRRSTCSLKCSALLQVVRNLDESYRFVALLDADTTTHPTWLRELATALADEQVGVATGNRWYASANGSVGSLVRYAWNAAAVVQMYWYQVAWGGTLAIKTRVFRETDLMEQWSRAFCEDTMLLAVLKQAGLRVAFVPSLMMINREECGLRSFFGWVSRQLLTIRLYHPAWPAVLAHGLWSALVPVAAFGLGIYAVSIGERSVAFWALAGPALYEGSVVVLLWSMERAVCRVADTHGEISQGWTFWSVIQCILIVPLTQIVYPMALLRSLVMRVVDWRGIVYRVEGLFRIQMKEYAPFRPTQSSNQSESL